jgi:hypothetical protein
MCHIRHLRTIGHSFGGKASLLSALVLFFPLVLPLFVGDEVVESSELNLVTDPSAVLSRYGEIIYQYNRKNPQQLFVVGMSHRDSLTRRNGGQTSRVQAEVYKIGEWLIHNKELDLLLPEGYFAKKDGKVKDRNLAVAFEREGQCAVPFDMDVLEAILSDNRTFVNAEMLLRDNHPSLRIRQVEDWDLYEAVGKRITELISQKNSCDYLLQKSELDYLQERRAAAMLQRIPDIINDEFRRGNIRDRRAFLTIGMSHIQGIIKYFDDNKITVRAPFSDSNHHEDYVAELNLLKENFGISVIIPRTLAHDQEILKLNKLEKVVGSARRKSLGLPSPVLP